MIKITTKLLKWQKNRSPKTCNVRLTHCWLSDKWPHRQGMCSHPRMHGVSRMEHSIWIHFMSPSWIFLSSTLTMSGLSRHFTGRISTYNIVFIWNLSNMFIDKSLVMPKDAQSPQLRSKNMSLRVPLERLLLLVLLVLVLRLSLSKLNLAPTTPKCSHFYCYSEYTIDSLLLMLRWYQCPFY